MAKRMMVLAILAASVWGALGMMAARYDAQTSNEQRVMSLSYQVFGGVR